MPPSGRCRGPSGRGERGIRRRHERLGRPPGPARRPCAQRGGRRAGIHRLCGRGRRNGWGRGSTFPARGDSSGRTARRLAALPETACRSAGRERHHLLDRFPDLPRATAGVAARRSLAPRRRGTRPQESGARRGHGRRVRGRRGAGIQLRQDPKAVLAFVRLWPREVEIVFSPAEVGDAIDYPPAQVVADIDWTDRHPIKQVYQRCDCATGQRMWDPLAVIQAVEGDAAFAMGERGTVEVTEDARTVFLPSPSGNCRRQLPGNPAWNAAMLEKIRAFTREKCNLSHPFRVK